MPSWEMSQPAAFTVLSASDPSSSMGLVVLICMKAFLAIAGSIEGVQRTALARDRHMPHAQARLVQHTKIDRLVVREQRAVEEHGRGAVHAA